MIHFGFTVENPWSDRFDPGYCWSGMITKHKAWEIQAYRSNVIAECETRISHRTDHAGIKLEIGLFSFSIILQFYDTRHWNYHTQTWEVYDDKEDLL